jgi:hypothetical protein
MTSSPKRSSGAKVIITSALTSTKIPKSRKKMAARRRFFGRDSAIPDRAVPAMINSKKLGGMASPTMR